MEARFRRQYSIGGFVIDFYCPKLKIAIEIDGDSHFSEEDGDRDKERQKIIESFGIKFLRFTNQDVYLNPEQVILQISNWIKSYST